MTTKKAGPKTKNPATTFKEWLKNAMKPIESAKDRPTNVNAQKLAKQVDK